MTDGAGSLSRPATTHGEVRSLAGDGDGDVSIKTSVRAPLLSPFRKLNLNSQPKDEQAVLNVLFRIKRSKECRICLRILIVIAGVDTGQ